LRRQIAVEQEQINRLIEIHRPLLLQCQKALPDGIAHDEAHLRHAVG
jgi:hypothetical protein